MKLSMTSKYMEELKQKYCDGNGAFIGAYAIRKGILTGKAFALFVNTDMIKVVRLGIYTLNIKEDYSINKKDIDTIKTKKGLIFNNVKIKTSDGKTHKFKIQKNVWTLKESQKEVFERLSIF
ncbi:hypothetical protein [Lacrimispora brassicae]